MCFSVLEREDEIEREGVIGFSGCWRRAAMDELGWTVVGWSGFEKVLVERWCFEGFRGALVGFVVRGVLFVALCFFFVCSACCCDLDPLCYVVSTAL